MSYQLRMRKLLAQWSFSLVYIVIKLLGFMAPPNINNPAHCVRSSLYCLPHIEPMYHGTVSQLSAKSLREQQSHCSQLLSFPQYTRLNFQMFSLYASFIDPAVNAPDWTLFLGKLVKVHYTFFEILFTFLLVWGFITLLA